MLICITAMGCGRNAPVVHFVIPDGYRGAFLVQTNQPEGVVVNSSGRCVCVIPEDGILKVKGDGPFYEWHSTTAVFADGTALTIANEPDRLEAYQIALWSDESRSGAMIYFFVGTKKEHEAFWKKSAAGQVPIGGIRGNRKGS